VPFTLERERGRDKMNACIKTRGKSKKIEKESERDAEREGGINMNAFINTPSSSLSDPSTPAMP